jgi:phosphatidylglycerophosphatase A
MTENGDTGVMAAGFKFFITGAYLGYMPVAPGSWGSLLACVILWFAFPAVWYYQLLVILVCYPPAVYLADKGVKYFGPDNRRIVIDELIGQSVALFMAPHNIVAYSLGFLLFRIFDIIKPQPARKWENIPGGKGVVADDIVAGIYAVIALHLIITLLRRWGATWL